MFNQPYQRPGAIRIGVAFVAALSAVSLVAACGSSSKGLSTAGGSSSSASGIYSRCPASASKPLSGNTITLGMTVAESGQ